jgi:hypothetical protein
MSKLIVMVNPENGKTADVPEQSMQQWIDWGWRVALPDAPPAEPGVAKGPRGKFYVKQDGKIISDPFDNELEAKAHLETLSAPKE